MKAFIMAGGFGKRLQPLTDKIPKSMIDVGGKPILYWQIKWLESYGIDKFVLLGGYKAEKLVRYIKSLKYGSKFEFSIEKQPLGTAGAIKNAKKFIDENEPFLVVNGDNITNLDIRKLKIDKGKLCCLSLVPYKSSKGIVNFKGKTITGFVEKPILKDYWFNAGVTLISPDILDLLPNKDSLEKEIFPKLAKSRRLSYVKYSSAYFNSVDSFKDIDTINNDFKLGKVKFGYFQK